MTDDLRRQYHADLDELEKSGRTLTLSPLSPKTAWRLLRTIQRADPTVQTRAVGEEIGKRMAVTPALREAVAEGWQAMKAAPPAVEEPEAENQAEKAENSEAEKAENPKPKRKKR